MKTSAITLGRADVPAVMAFHAIHLVSWAVLGRSLGLGAWFLGGVVVAAAQALTVKIISPCAMKAMAPAAWPSSKNCLAPLRW